MMIRYRFVQDDTVQDIDVTVRAEAKNKTVKAFLAELQAIVDRSTCGQAFMETYGIYPDDVITVMRDGRYVTARTTAGEHTIKEALIYVEEKLDPQWFVRISQSEIINLKHVKRWNFVGGGIVQIEMKNNITCYASRRFTSRIRDRLRKGRTA